MKPPENGEGPRGSGPTAKLTGLSEDTSLREFAQSCTHPVTRTERFPGGVPHYSHEVCVACGHHLRWHPKPRNLERRKLLAIYVARLQTCPGLTPWQEHFVGSLCHLKKFSPKQETVLARIYHEFFGKSVL